MLKLIKKLMSLGRDGDEEALLDVLPLLRELEEKDSVYVNDHLIYDQENLKDAHALSKELRSIAGRLIKSYGSDKLVDLYRNTLLFDGPHDFDAFCLGLEWERPRDRKFYEPRRKQLKPLADALQELETGDIELLGISTPPGIGKALANDTPILTRKGWKNHGDLVVGDEVIGLDGKFKKVIAVHPKCQLDCQVMFTNGEKIVCHENHEWLIHDRGVYDKSKMDHIVETKRLEKRALSSGGEMGERGHRYPIQLPNRPKVVGEQKNLPLDPYTLGVWLGDGANQAPRISCDPKDKAVIDRIVRNGIPMRWSTVHKDTGVLYFGFDIRSQLRQMDMCHSRKRLPKHIPEEYLTASMEQRLELLAGLLDTDGTLCGSKYQFSTTEIKLRNTFCELIATFGWRTSVVEYAPVVSSSGVIGRKTCYNISFTPDICIPCELERKQNKEPHKQRRIGFMHISRVEPREGNCITVEGDGMYLAGKTMLPTHNTTLALFFLAWIGGRNPELSILGGSHSNSFLEGIYTELLRILGRTSDEYCYELMFPVKVVSCNARGLRIDLDKRKRFETYQFSSIGSGNAGKVRASKLLYCDDLVSDIEQAMSRDRMDKLWQQYYTDLRQRKIGTCRELHIATRWSVHDVLGRLENEYANDPKAKFIRLPALNEDDESNFDYPYNLGFTTEFYREQRTIMDTASWKALYMNEPIEREGLLVDRDKLRRFFDLPEGEPDAVIGACDTKTTGKDFCSLPIAYQYGNDYYITEVFFENYAPDIVETNLIEFLKKTDPQQARFESNVAGGKLAQIVQEHLKEANCRCRITTKWTQANKDTKIIVNMPWVMENCLFLDDSVLKDSKYKEYREFLNQLCSYTMAGKNKHDDAADSMAQLAIFVQNFTGNRVKIGKRIF